MSGEQFDIHIAELKAQLAYLLSLLDSQKAPGANLRVLEQLARVREELLHTTRHSPASTRVRSYPS
jgi:hypothetical protein